MTLLPDRLIPKRLNAKISHYSRRIYGQTTTGSHRNCHRRWTGLGQAISFRLAQEGCHVAVADLNEASAIETAGKITERKAIAIKTDVTDETQVAALVDRVVD